MECTVSTEQGRTWQEYTDSTRSRIVLPCPHCGDWTTLEREHLVAWREADSQVAAKATSMFACSECGEALDPHDVDTRIGPALRALARPPRTESRTGDEQSRDDRSPTEG